MPNRLLPLLLALFAFSCGPSLESEESELTDVAQEAVTEQTVTADALPTVQIDGVVWAQAISGNTVYATGQFANARPAGAAAGTGNVARGNLLAYNITTGVLDTSFVHALEGTGAEGRAIAVAGNRLYVGGNFTSVDGQARKNIAAFDLTTKALLPAFAAPAGRVRAIAATDTRVFIGGAFSTVAGQARVRLAAYNLDGTLVSGWAPSVEGNVPSVTALTIAQGNLIIGGAFNKVAGLTYYSLAAVKLTTGAPVTPWASQSASFPIRNQYKENPDPSAGTGVTSLSTDGTNVFFTSYGFGSPSLDAFYEGRAAISAVDGKLLWANDCHGDSYSAIPLNGVLYSVGHAHDCRPMGGFPESSPLTWRRGIAENLVISGVNVAPVDPKYTNLTGISHTTQLPWYPDFAAGTFTGMSQGGWSVTGNANYVSVGGEFPRVNGTAQQGLVRFAISNIAPNKRGPAAFPAGAVAASSANAAGASVVIWKSTWDPDNGTLSYKAFRDSGTTVLATASADSRFWIAQTMSFTDSGLAANSVHSYRVVANDSPGNNTAQATTPAGAFTPVSNWTNTACLDATHACVTYRMEIRQDAAGAFSAWVAVVPSPNQGTKTAVLRVQVTSVTLGTAAAVSTTGGPFAFSTPHVFGETAKVTSGTPSALRTQLTFSVRYADNALLQKTTGFLNYGQKN